MLIAAGMLVGCGGGVKNADLAAVDGDRITADDFHSYLEIKPRVKVNSNQGVVEASVAQTLGYQALDDLIRQKAVLHLAKDEGVFPSDADIQNEIEFQKKRNPNFLHDAQSMGLTVDQIKQQLTLSLAIEKLLSKGITVSKDDVDQYIKDHPDEFRDPEKVDLDWIVVSTDEEKKQVDAELLSGQRFAAVAQRYSKADNARAYQGRYPIQNVNQLAQQLRDLIAKTPELKATDWVKSGTVWAKWYVEKKTPAKEKPIDDVTREGVRRQIAIRRGNAATDLDKRVAEKLKQSKIEVSPPLYKQLWEQSMQNIENTMSSKTPTPATPVTPSVPERK